MNVIPLVMALCGRETVGFDRHRRPPMIALGAAGSGRDFPVRFPTHPGRLQLSTVDTFHSSDDTAPSGPGIFLKIEER